MNSYPQPRTSKPTAFTLVELLTVIAIIAILMGLLFPAINIAREQARKAQAKTDATSICAAVKAYYSEYGKYPLGALATQNQPGDVLFGMSATGGVSPINNAPTSNFALFDILRGTDSTGQTAPGQPNSYNPRAIVFFDGRIASDPSNPKAGFVPTSSGGGGSGGGPGSPGAYMDPWGTEYFVVIDANYDNQIADLPYHDTNFTTTNGPRTGVCVFSLGKDRVLGTATTAGATSGDGYYKNQTSGTNSDDIVSWQ